MKIPAIKNLVESNSLEELENAESALLNGKVPSITIEGSDEGEQLTHVIAAIWIKREMNQSGCDMKTALRAYTQKVRNSIT